MTNVYCVIYLFADHVAPVATKVDVDAHIRKLNRRRKKKKSPSTKADTKPRKSIHADYPNDCSESIKQKDLAPFLRSFNFQIGVAPMPKTSNSTRLDLVGKYACLGDMLGQQMITSAIQILPEFCVSLPGKVNYRGETMASIMNNQTPSVYGAVNPGCNSFNHKFYVSCIQLIALSITMNCADLVPDLPKTVFHVPGKEKEHHPKKVFNYGILFVAFEHNKLVLHNHYLRMPRIKTCWDIKQETILPWSQDCLLYTSPSPRD